MFIPLRCAPITAEPLLNCSNRRWTRQATKPRRDSMARPPRVNVAAAGSGAQLRRLRNSAAASSSAVGWLGAGTDRRIVYVSTGSPTRAGPRSGALKQPWQLTKALPTAKFLTDQPFVVECAFGAVLNVEDVAWLGRADPLRSATRRAPPGDREFPLQLGRH
eukprot:SAG11_NODE_3244_length_2585_cov_1.163315_2_plen_162_part_00